MPFDPSALPGDNPVGSATTVLPVATVSDYLLTFTETEVKYIIGEDRPLKWSLSRADGANCEIPTGATITVTAPDGSISTVTPSIDSSVSVPTLHLAALYIFALPGAYLALISVTVNGETVKSEINLLAS